MKDILCPICKKPMILRTNKILKNVFWGCSDYPKCQGTISIFKKNK
jgi:ssDNA-binding Zn-finger/Zn-ribbon topoisomerase 1